MTDEQIRDLKDFITTVVRQEIGSQIQDQTAVIKGEFGELRSEFGELKSEFGELRSEFGELKRSVSDLELKVDTIAEAVGVQFDEQQALIEGHETRITKLEAHPA